MRLYIESLDSVDIFCYVFFIFYYRRFGRNLACWKVKMEHAYLKAAFEDTDIIFFETLNMVLGISHILICRARVTPEITPLGHPNY